jgi:alpha-ketoglutarate-dependent taurine dioxygenase
MANLVVRDLGPVFGAEVSGLEPKVPLDADTVKQLRKLFDEKRLLLFRDIDVDREFQTYLSYAIIGREAPVQDPSAPPKRESFISNKLETGIAPFGRLLWHTDMMWHAEASELLSLYGVDVGQPSPPTMFVSAENAWKTLPADLKARVENRDAEHVHDISYERSGGDANVLTAKFDDDDCVRMPVANRHPRTGETLLYVCQQMTSGIADLPKEESDELLETLFQHLYAPENILKHEWRQGDLVMWDNLALQHARPNVETEGPARTLRKTFAPMPEIFKTMTPQFGKAGVAA